MCDSCNALTINGVYCHETGCPDSWKGIEKECEWCGARFMPETENQEFCNDTCSECFND